MTKNTWNTVKDKIVWCKEKGRRTWVLKKDNGENLGHVHEIAVDCRKNGRFQVFAYSDRHTMTDVKGGMSTDDPYEAEKYIINEVYQII